MLTVVFIAQPWATDHGHFMQMGGFKVSMTQSEFNDLWTSEEPAFKTRTKINEVDVVEGVLTLECFKALLRRNRIAFPTISKDEIDDKSKGDALSKGIAYLQLAWFIAQIITRAAQGLAITELELTTAALCIYFGGANHLTFAILSLSCQGVLKSCAHQDRKERDGISRAGSLTYVCTCEAVRLSSSRTPFLLQRTRHTRSLLSGVVQRNWTLGTLRNLKTICINPYTLPSAY